MTDSAGRSASVPEPVRLEVDGVVYRVFDATMRAGKLIVGDPPKEWATTRVFRPRKGYRRLFRLKTPADRAFDEETLRRQLAAADYLPTMAPGATDQDPR
jgi:hypothetical protein